MLRNQVLPEPGDLIGSKYRIDRELGAGGMGVVFAAINLDTEKHVALKFLTPELSRTAEAVQRFKLEARATGRIHHPNVVAVHDCGEHEQRLYLVMELLQGVSLREAIARRPLSPEEACHILFPVMRGIAAAHEAGVLHRDLKPENIFLANSPDGLEPVPKVLDFGLAKLSAESDRTMTLSVPGAVMGTYQFMAPEQLRPDGELDGRVDVYALGVVLFNMLSGRLPYTGDNPIDVALQILKSQAPLVTAYAPAVPAQVAEIVACALAPRNERYPSVEAFALALEPHAGGARFRGTRRSGDHQHDAEARRPDAGKATVTSLGTPFGTNGFEVRPSRPKRVLRWAAVLVVILGGIGAGAYQLLRSQGSRPGAVPRVDPSAFEAAEQSADSHGDSPVVPVQAGRPYPAENGSSHQGWNERDQARPDEPPNWPSPLPPSARIEAGSSPAPASEVKRKKPHAPRARSRGVDREPAARVEATPPTRDHREPDQAESDDQSVLPVPPNKAGHPVGRTGTEFDEAEF